MLKPKDISLILNIKPYEVSNILREISSIYTFNQTPFGSFLVKEEEIEYIKIYRNAVFFLKNKDLALEQLHYFIEDKKKDKQIPNWIFMIRNGLHSF